MQKLCIPGSCCEPRLGNALAEPSSHTFPHLRLVLGLRREPRIKFLRSRRGYILITCHMCTCYSLLFCYCHAADRSYSQAGSLPHQCTRNSLMRSGRTGRRRPCQREQTDPGQASPAQNSICVRERPCARSCRTAVAAISSRNPCTTTEIAPRDIRSCPATSAAVLARQRSKVVRAASPAFRQGGRTPSRTQDTPPACCLPPGGRPGRYPRTGRRPGDLSSACPLEHLSAIFFMTDIFRDQWLELRANLNQTLCSVSSRTSCINLQELITGIYDVRE
ncbi:hypothetical protein OBBRIDRAFT_625294 [Obba rivulosa]|uniref:Uncharacterized protein n=1 Tax=Obba rivulosa TaxID=1052685 RepID=A0A8E2B0U4_9APHY|nr:hypothetical protein OBBRIDRAFT_625294 [Obba rivulosa]